MYTHAHTYTHTYTRMVYTYIRRGDSRHTHMCAYAHAVLAHLHAHTSTPTSAWCVYIHCAQRLETHSLVCICTCSASILACARMHTYTCIVCIHCAQRLETNSRTYVHASFFGALESPRIVYTYTVRGDSRHTHMCAYAHAVLAYLHVLACTPTRA